MLKPVTVANKAPETVKVFLKARERKRMGLREVSDCHPSGLFVSAASPSMVQALRLLCSFQRLTPASADESPVSTHCLHSCWRSSRLYVYSSSSSLIGIHQ